MKIGFDLDEILAAHLSAVMAYHNEKYGTKLEYHQFHSHQWEKVWGGTRAESVAKVFDFVKTHHFQSIQPVKGAIGAVDILSQKHELFVITSRQIELREATHAWVAKHFPNKFRQVFVTNHPNWARGGKTTTKAVVCREIGVDVLIEDSIEYAKECVSTKTQIILFDKPWNKGEVPKGVHRVCSWKEIVEHELLR